MVSFGAVSRLTLQVVCKRPPHTPLTPCEAVSQAHSAKADAMREWSVGGQIGLLKWLTDATDEIKPQDRYEL